MMWQNVFRAALRQDRYDTLSCRDPYTLPGCTAVKVYRLHGLLLRYGHLQFLGEPRIAQ